MVAKKSVPFILLLGPGRSGRFHLPLRRGRPDAIAPAPPRARARLRPLAENRLDTVLPELMRRERHRHVAGHLPGIRRGPGLPFARALDSFSARRLTMLVFFDRGKRRRRKVHGRPIRDRRPLPGGLGPGKNRPVGAPGPDRQGAQSPAHRHRRIRHLRLRRRAFGVE